MSLLSRKRARKDLDQSQRYRIVTALQKREKTQVQLAEEYGCSQSSIAAIWKNREKILDRIETGEVSASKKRIKASKIEDVRKSLLEWFKEQADKNVVGITEEILLEQARTIASEIGYDDDSQINVSAIKRWKKDNMICSKRVVGEANDVRPEMTHDWLTSSLPAILSKYDEDNIYNCDECGLFWKLLPDRTHTFKNKKCIGGKKSKERLTLCLGTNMSGSDKLPPLIIGKFTKPRALKNLKIFPGKIIYRANSKAWMTSAIWEEYLKILDRKFRQMGRQIALIFDNCAAHPNVKGLTNIEIFRLPPNTTATLQPMDAGIIKNFKSNYRKLLAKKLIGCLNSDIPMDHNLLHAMNFIDQSWAAITQKTVSACFRHCFVKTDSEPTKTVSCEENLPEDEEWDEIWKHMCSNGLVPGQLPFGEYISCDSILVTRLSREVSEPSPVPEFPDDLGQEVDDEEDDDEPPPVPTGSDCQRMLESLRYYMMCSSGFPQESFKHLNSLENAFQRHFVTQKNQKLITDYFVKG